MTITQSLLKKIDARSASIAIIGLGYVGLPLLKAFAQQGFSLLGIDINKEKIKQLQQGISYIDDIANQELEQLTVNPKVSFSDQFDVLEQADIVIICVPTPLRKSKEPDISYILSAAHNIKTYIRKGHLIILESTTYPGTTDEILLPLFSRQNMKIGQDFLLVFSPERVDPGNKNFSTINIPKVIGGVTSEGGQVAAQLYQTIIKETHLVSSARVAEASKLLENTFRSVNIALVNEFSRICRILEIDVWEVIEAAATKPFGFMPFSPGPGIGGHCIPLDPHYLIWKSRLHGYDPQFISLAEQINSSMPGDVVNLISDSLNDHSKPIRNSKILIIGVAYKENVADIRESPALEVIELLLHKGAVLSYIDPYVPELTINDQAIPSYSLKSGEHFDCLVLITAHSNLPYEELIPKAPLIIDTRNKLKDYSSEQNIIKL